MTMDAIRRSNRNSALLQLKNLVAEKAHLLVPFQEDMTEYFKWVDEEKRKELVSEGNPDGYERRPTIGLQIQVDGNRVLAIRPGWVVPHKHYPLEGKPIVTTPGKINPDIITLEFLPSAIRKQYQQTYRSIDDPWDM